ncbi:hypothetical protein HN958_04045 [Candidatus Falkowbacteria bacterium]|jgi:hypothetical protein|nr:hypothetical protein [Candidatus Falkowbacteria bacterium]MBT7007648.1 hypothetical protein [Candidatus Falkowbacteria bacterium]
MFSYFNKNKDTIGLLLIIVIFGSGFAIYGYNRLNGVNLTDPIEVNLSDFDLPLVKPQSLSTIYFSNYYKKESGNETLLAIQSDLQNYDSIKDLFVEIITDEQSEYIAKIDCRGQCNHSDLELLKTRKNIVVK